MDTGKATAVPTTSTPTNAQKKTLKDVPLMRHPWTAQDVMDRAIERGITITDEEVLDLLRRIDGFENLGGEYLQNAIWGSIDGLLDGTDPYLIPKEDIKNRRMKWNLLSE